MKRRPLICFTVFLILFLFCACAPDTRNETQASDQAQVPVDILLADAAVGADDSVLREEAVCSVLFIRAGKADAALVQAGERNVLIDAGEESSVPMILGALRLMGAEQLLGRL